MTAETMSAAAVLSKLLDVRQAALAHEQRMASEFGRLPLPQQISVSNLTHYLAVRQFDLREEQRALARLGLSSLGRAESHVLATLDAVIRRLAFDVGVIDPPEDLGTRGPSPDEGAEMLARHARDALGPAPDGHGTRVMVTLPSEAASSTPLVDRLVSAGMTIARINCAHDGPAEWAAMAKRVRDRATHAGRAVRVAFDLPGPKLRTGPLPPGPRVVRARPRRNSSGRVRRPAHVRFTTDAVGSEQQRPAAGATVEVPVGAEIVDGAQVGDELTLHDSRGRNRRFTIIDTGPTQVDAVCDRTAYLSTDTQVVRRRGSDASVSARIGPVAPIPSAIEVRAGEPLELRRGDEAGRSARMGESGELIEPAFVSVDVPEVFAAVSVGDRVLIDDGRIEGVVVSVDADRIELDVRRPGVAKLRAEKGINLPDTDLDIAALTTEDLADLAVVAPLADMVALSYVGGPGDVDRLHAELDRLGAPDVGVILKIEHRSAFEALPQLLLHALRRPPVAVMVARGDLAVEVGFQRLAELQEEILWLSEAAHVPVIWATQVLESLAKHGAPTRAEVTDAAWATRAECVMLNKGPHIPDTIRFLDDILTRMREHQQKRTPMLRRLAVADSFGPVEAQVDDRRRAQQRTALSDTAKNEPTSPAA